MSAWEERTAAAQLAAACRTAIAAACMARGLTPAQGDKVQQELTHVPAPESVSAFMTLLDAAIGRARTQYRYEQVKDEADAVAAMRQQVEERDLINKGLRRGY